MQHSSFSNGLTLPPDLQRARLACLSSPAHALPLFVFASHTWPGWQFNGQGACTRIPQIGDPKAAATACSSSKSCVASFPVKVCSTCD